jgi:hypothetical protein
MAVCQNLVPLVNIKIAGKWMFIPLKMVLIGIDPYLYLISLNISRFGNPSTGKHDAQVLEKGNGKPDQSGLKSS